MAVSNRLERFTRSARQVLSRAQAEAERQRHAEIDTEHLLIGILRVDSGGGAQALRKLHVEVFQAEAVARDLARDKSRASGHPLDLSADTRKALEYGVDEARRMTHNFVSSEHLLLGLLRLDGCNAIRVLRKLNVSIEAIRREVIALHANRGETAPAPRTPPPSQPPTRVVEYLLTRISTRSRTINHFPVDLSPGVKSALEAALKELAFADRLYLSERHLLLGLISDPASLVSRALLDMGIDRDKLIGKLRDGGGD